MTPSNHCDYYVARAAKSRHLAQSATDPHIAKIHTDFARMYDAAANAATGQDRQPELRIVQR